MVYLQDVILKSNNKIRLKWYELNDGVFKNNMIVVKNGNSIVAYVASVSFKRKVFGETRLSSAIRIESSTSNPLGKTIDDHVTNIWTNREGHYTLPANPYITISALTSLRIEFLDWGL
jgi:hypothetical protein